MMEFIAGFGIGLWIGAVSTLAAIIYMRGKGYTVTRTAQLTDREADTLGKSLDTLTSTVQAQGERIDALNDLVADADTRLGEIAKAEAGDRERIDKLVDVVTLDKEDE